MHTKSIRVGVVDDHALFRKTLVHYLTQQHEIQVPFDVTSSKELLKVLRTVEVDVLLLDVFLREGSVLDFLSELKVDFPTVKILVLSMCTDQGVIDDLFGFGIHGYVSKSEDPEKLINAIKSANLNKLYRSEFFTEFLYARTEQNFSGTNRKPSISFDERETTIIKLLWEEKNNKEIAKHLFLGIRSVEKLRQELKEKVGAKTTIGLLKYALSKRIVRQDAR